MNNSVAVVNLSLNDAHFGGKKRDCDFVLETITEPIMKLPKRILFSFMPPFVYNRQYMFTDFLGPTLSTLILVSLLQYGFSCKKTQQYNFSAINAVSTVLIYYLMVSFFIFIAASVVKVRLKILDVLTLIGYSFYGFIFTLLIPFILNKYVHEYIFYLSLALFGGLSCFRVLLILLFAVDVPVARFLICSFIGNVHLLFVIYLYYFYMHPTYKFREPIGRF